MTVYVFVKKNLQNISENCFVIYKKNLAAH